MQVARKLCRNHWFHPILNVSLITSFKTASTTPLLFTIIRLEAIIALRQPLIGLKSVKFVKYQGIVDEYNVNKAYFVLDKGEEMSQIDKDNNISSMKSLKQV
ncbi:unnamed protein product [Rhizophagus irregularis]|nr:unnamed protein product [Rhizophagus irregularis]